MVNVDKLSILQPLWNTSGGASGGLNVERTSSECWVLDIRHTAMETGDVKTVMLWSTTFWRHYLQCRYMQWKLSSLSIVLFPSLLSPSQFSSLACKICCENSWPLIPSLDLHFSGLLLAFMMRIAISSAPFRSLHMCTSYSQHASRINSYFHFVDLAFIVLSTDCCCTSCGNYSCLICTPM